MDIAVLGYGVVGSGVAEVISLNEQKITGKIGEKMNVKNFRVTKTKIR